MTRAAITLSKEGLCLARAVAAGLGDCDLFVHRQVDAEDDVRQFDSVVKLTGEIFGHYQGLIYILPCGVAVRCVAGHVQHKKTDPAVVVVDVGGRWAVSLLSGHEGGANELAVNVANILGAEPVISTTTEAVKNLIVGVGCRRGVAKESIVNAIKSALSAAGVSIDDVRLLATADIKHDETGLLEAARYLNLPVRFIPSDEIRACNREFTHSPVAQKNVNLPAVAEPAALLAGRRTELLLPKQKYQDVTVAVAKESFMWSD